MPRKTRLNGACTDCGKPIDGRSNRCQPCWHLLNQRRRHDDTKISQAKGLEAMNRRAYEGTVRDLSPKARANKEKGVAYQHHGACTACTPPKPIVYGTRCYEHSGPGRVRTLFRPDELREQIA